MTRRKRTGSLSSSASPSVPSKRVAFEIPASLHQLSSISRSLATLATHTNHTGSSGAATASPRTRDRTQTQTQPETQPRPASQSSSRPAPPLAITHPPNQIPVNNFPPQSPAIPVPNPKPWLGPPSRDFLPVTANTKSSVSKPKPKIPQPPKVKTPQPKPTTSNSTPVVRTPSEPSLGPGETPNLKTHPNLIASLIAQKRAANEAAGHRLRWQKNQVEYRAGKSPGSQLMTELTMEATRASPKPSKPRSVSTPIQARPGPLSVTNTRSFPPTNGNSKPAAETVTTLETERSTPEADSRKDAQPNDAETDQGDSDDGYGSPFSSPIAEFLEAATDHAGLGKDTARTTRLPGQPSEFKKRPSSIAHEYSSLTWPLQDGNIGPSLQVGNTLPFAEPPQSHQQNQSLLVQSPFPPNPSRSLQHQSSPHFPSGQLQTANPIPTSATTVHQQYHYMNPQFPAGQQNFYKASYPQHYATSNGSGGSPIPTPTPVAIRQPSFQQSFSNTPGFNSLDSYPTQPLGGLSMSGFAPRGSGPIYGTSMNKPSTNQTRVFMTAADMVAGMQQNYSHMRFGTKLDFVVAPSQRP